MNRVEVSVSTVRDRLANDPAWHKSTTHLSLIDALTTVPIGKCIVKVRMVIQKIQRDGAYTSRELFKDVYLRGTRRFHPGV